MTSVHLSVKEVWRNKGRFLLFSMVIALITLLVLFVAALGEGLGSGNREYLSKLNGELVIFSESSELNASSSRLDRATQRAIRNVSGVQDSGAVGFAGGAVPYGGNQRLDVSVIGVEPGRPGEPVALEGVGLERRSGDEALIDKNIAAVTGLGPGDDVIIRSIQEDEETFYTLRITGVTESQKSGIRPSIFVPYVTWDRIRPQAVVGNQQGDLNSHIVVVRLEQPSELAIVQARIESQVPRTEAVDRVTAYENLPGYSEQQVSLDTQRYFALLIGVLVIGGFFQIQTLQKVPQIGMLKAIGTPNGTIAIASLIQIVLVTVVGAAIGASAALGLSLFFPPNIPIIFAPQSTGLALASILLIGPVGGLVSIRYSLKVEPLRALGLG